MTASAGSGAGPAVSQCELSGVRDGVLSTHPQSESRLDLFSHVWEWLRHGGVEECFSLLQGPSVPAFDTMLLTRTQPYQQGHTANRVHACNLSYACTYIRSTAACIVLLLVSLKGESTASNTKYLPRQKRHFLYNNQDITSYCLLCRHLHMLAHADTSQFCQHLQSMVALNSQLKSTHIGTSHLYEQRSVHTGIVPLQVRSLCHVPGPTVGLVCQVERRRAVA